MPHMKLEESGGESSIDFSSEVEKAAAVLLIFASDSVILVLQSVSRDLQKG